MNSKQVTVNQRAATSLIKDSLEEAVSSLERFDSDSTDPHDSSSVSLDVSSVDRRMVMGSFRFRMGRGLDGSAAAGIMLGTRSAACFKGVVTTRRDTGPPRPLLDTGKPVRPPDDKSCGAGKGDCCCCIG